MGVTVPGTVSSGATPRPAGHGMRRLVAVLFVAHGVATMVGFAWPWRLAEPPSYDVPDESVLLLLGDPVRLIMNGLWLAAGLGFLGAAWALRHAAPGWRSAATVAAILSLALCLIDWPAAVVGLAINSAILVLMWRTRRSDGALGPAALLSARHARRR